MHNNINVAVGGPINADYPKVYKTKFLKPGIPFSLQVTDPNTKYVIKYNFELDSDVTIPENCILDFDGGSINNTSNNNYEVILQDAYIDAPINITVFNVKVIGTLSNKDIYAYWFGCNNSGEDKTENIRVVFGLSKDGSNLIFDKGTKITVEIAANSTISLEKSNISITGLNIELVNTMPLFSVGSLNNDNPSKNVVFNDCIFSSSDNSQMLIYLNAAENVTISNCMFDHVGYCVLQQQGYVSNNVRIINNTARNLIKDFVEANCTYEAPSSNWIISNNIFEGNYNYPNWDDVEQRFIGITAVNNVVISNNIAMKSSADAMIHLEDIGGNVVISDNVFKNAVGYFVWVMSNNYKNFYIGGNIFEIDDINCCNKGSYGDVSVTPYFIAFMSNVLSEISPLIVNNTFKGISHNSNYYGTIYGENFIIESNKFDSCFGITGRINQNIRNNTFINCNYCLTTDTSGSKNIKYVGNLDINTVIKSIDIHIDPNSNRYAENCIISNNVLGSDVFICDPKNLIFKDNILSEKHSVNYRNIVNFMDISVLDDTGNIYNTVNRKNLLLKDIENSVPISLDLYYHGGDIKIQSDDSWPKSIKSVYVEDTEPTYAEKGTIWFNTNPSINKLLICKIEGEHDTYLLTLSGVATSDGSIILTYKGTPYTVNIKKGQDAKSVASYILKCVYIPEWCYFEQGNNVVIRRMKAGWESYQLSLDITNIPSGFTASLSYNNVGTSNTWVDSAGTEVQI